jgi:hypothetical protein
MCFLTSNFLRDSDPAAVSSGNRRVEISKLEFYGANKVARDKVRCPDRSHLMAGVSVHPSSDTPSFILCTQGSLQEAAGLVSIESKRPHKARMILNNFHGKPFNSPCEIVSNPIDHAVYFTDPAYGYERGFRPKPKLPSSHIYRFHPATGDCRVVIHDVQRPSGLAFSPDYRSLYVSELLDSHDGVYIHAFEVTYSNASKDPSFKISTLPGSKHAASSSSGSASSAHHHRPQLYVTPESSPQLRATHVGAASSHSRSTSTTRTPETGSHKLLTTMTNGLKSHPWIPRSEPPLDTLPQLGPPFQSNKNKVDTFISTRRFIAYSPNAVPSGAISTDPVHGDIWLGTKEGVEVWNANTGELTGKILVEEWDTQWTEGQGSKKMRGVSKILHINESEALLLGGERIWRLRMGFRGLQF